MNPMRRITFKLKDTLVTVSLISHENWCSTFYNVPTLFYLLFFHFMSSFCSALAAWVSGLAECEVHATE